MDVSEYYENSRKYSTDAATDGDDDAKPSSIPSVTLTKPADGDNTDYPEQLPIEKPRRLSILNLFQRRKSSNSHLAQVAQIKTTNRQRFTSVQVEYEEVLSPTERRHSVCDAMADAKGI